MRNPGDASNQDTTLGVSPSDIPSVTIQCSECQTQFTPQGRQKFCTNVCRQRAYRKSPAHRAQLDGVRNQRRNRRAAWHVRKNRHKYLSFDGRYSGPLANGVPSLGMLDLKNFSKE